MIYLYKPEIMKKLIVLSTIALFVMIIFSCRNGHAMVIKRDLAIHIQNRDIVFIQRLDSALDYLKSVCGENGIDRVVVMKEGKIVYHGAESEVIQKVWSCTKSFTSTVLGLLIAGNKCSLDDQVCDYLPELKEYYPELTFRHFTTMTSGYRAIGDEPRGSYVHGPSYTPHLPSPAPLFTSGTEFRYWDSAMNMFARALTNVAKEPIKHVFKRRIAIPIGMDPAQWEWGYFAEVDGIRVNGGAGNNNWGISISAAEFAKFGQLMLQNGRWNGKELLPEEWVKAASSPQVQNIIAGNTTPYGFNWWTDAIFPSAPKGTYAAKGFNNNICIIIPAWNMVVVRLGQDGNMDDEKWNSFIKILSEAF